MLKRCRDKPARSYGVFTCCLRSANIKKLDIFGDNAGKNKKNTYVINEDICISQEGSGLNVLNVCVRHSRFRRLLHAGSSPGSHI